MSFISSSASAIGRLAALVLLAAAFLFGLTGVVYMSLQGTEVKVPEITGKNLSDGEKELASLGLKIKKRADRPSQEAPGTVIEQLPRAGDTVKTGQMILVVTSKGPGEGDERPASLKKATEEDDTDKIEEMITDKPKKKSNSNSAKKKPDTTRDVNAITSDTNSGSDGESGNSNKKESGNTSSSGEKGNKNTQSTGPVKPGATSKPTEKPKPKPPGHP
ncbi:MAG: PASTA domain-containing protein [Acidobacteria bacterium]|nr:PASTA domain-containing protein [Acidobacteriota bacterium]